MVVFYFLGLCHEATVTVTVRAIPAPTDASIFCESAMNKIIYTMRHIMSTDEENLDDSLTEIFVKRAYEINYVPFSKKDRLCIELLQPISFADDSSGRAILLSYLQNSSLPIMKIVCAFMRKCFMGKFFGTNSIAT